MIRRSQFLIPNSQFPILMIHTYLTLDLGFGDAGKGSMVDFLCRQTPVHTVVRYNGGAQAGHRVATPAGREHVFSQFGSGTLAGAATHLSRFMLVEPLAMMAEAAHLSELGIADPFANVTIDENAVLTTPFHRAVNRLKELARGDGRHGSCGVGIGETAVDALTHPRAVPRVGDLRRPDTLRAKLEFLQAINLEKAVPLRPGLPDKEIVMQELAVLEESGWIDWLMGEYGRFSTLAHIVPASHLHQLLHRPGTVVFEGAQGVLLDEWVGFHPHTTWSNITFANADTLLKEAGYGGTTTRLGLTRAYTTRHGAGPFVSEDAALTQLLPDARNGHHAWQQGFRVGWLDLLLLRYALDVVGGVDYLAVNCLDRIADLPELQLCTAYQHGSQRLERLVPSPQPRDLAYQARLTAVLGECQPLLERVADPAALLDRVASGLGVPVGVVSWGETAVCKQCAF